MLVLFILLVLNCRANTMHLGLRINEQCYKCECLTHICNISLCRLGGTVSNGPYITNAGRNFDRAVQILVLLLVTRDTRHRCFFKSNFFCFTMASYKFFNYNIL